MGVLIDLRYMDYLCNEDSEGGSEEVNFCDSHKEDGHVSNQITEASLPIATKKSEGGTESRVEVDFSKDAGEVSFALLQNIEKIAKQVKRGEEEVREGEEEERGKSEEKGKREERKMVKFNSMGDKVSEIQKVYFLSERNPSLSSQSLDNSLKSPNNPRITPPNCNPSSPPTSPNLKRESLKGEEEEGGKSKKGKGKKEKKGKKGKKGGSEGKQKLSQSSRSEELRRYSVAHASPPSTPPSTSSSKRLRSSQGDTNNRRKVTSMTVDSPDSTSKNASWRASSYAGRGRRPSGAIMSKKEVEELYLPKIRRFKLGKVGEVSWSNEELSNVPPSSLFEKLMKKLKEEKQTVERICLDRNKIETLTGSEFATISSFNLNNQLKVLSVSHNMLRELDKGISLLSSLTHLDFSFNLLSSLPPQIGELLHLKKLFLQYNKISQLPSSLSNLLLLNTFDISCNLLSSIPKELSSCISLKSAKFEDNPLVSPPISVAKKGWKAIIKYWLKKKGEEEGVQETTKNPTAALISLLHNQQQAGSSGGGEEYVELSLDEELMVVMSSPFGLKCFMSFLESVYAHENLLFIIKVDEYKCAGEDPIVLEKLAKEIHSEFIDPESPQAVNLPFEFVGQMKSKISERGYTIDLFDSSRQHIFSVLAVDKMMSFRKSKFYQEYLAHQQMEVLLKMTEKKRNKYLSK